MSALKQVVGALIMMGAVTAIAQPADPTPPAPAPAPATAPADPAVTAPPVVQLSATEMRTRSVTLQAQIQGDYRYTVGLQDSVRKKKDVIKLTCVNDRLVQMKAQMNIADKASSSVEALLDRDATAAREPFSELERSAHGVQELREQANQCVGEPELYKQEAGLEVTRPDLVDDPGVFDPYDPATAGVEPPGHASAFM